VRNGPEAVENFAFMLPVTMSLFGIVFLVVGWFEPQSARAWGLAFLFGAAGFLAPILPIPIRLQALFGNAAFFISFFYYGEALLRHFEAPRLVFPRLVFALVGYGAIIVAVVGLESLQLELTVGDLFSAILLGVPVMVVLWRAKTLADRVLVTIAAIVVIDIVVRLFIFNVLIGMSDQLADFANSSYTYYMQVSVSVLSVSFALAALSSVVVAMLARYRHAAERDPLTDLLNRRGFDAAVLALAPSRRRQGAVMTCDIDHFKQVNDSFGHASGDLVLAGLSDLLLSRLPPGGLVARFGGEEFVVFLPDTTLRSAVALGQSMRMDFSARDWRQAGVFSQITISMGVASLFDSDSSLYDALSRADRALYAAKSSGRNQVMMDAGEAYVPALRIVPAV